MTVFEILNFNKELEKTVKLTPKKRRKEIP
jgi:hypothetical protein